VDPVGGSVGSSQSWNRYSYVLNNPVRNTDPTGEAVPNFYQPDYEKNAQVRETLNQTLFAATPYRGRVVSFLLDRLIFSAAFPQNPGEFAAAAEMATLTISPPLLIVTGSPAAAGGGYGPRYLGRSPTLS